MTDINPYEPTVVEPQTRPVQPHSTSARIEAWRGFKLGARLTGIATTVMMATIMLFAVGMFVYMTVKTQGDFLFVVPWSEVPKFVGSSIAMIALMSLYGGIAGAIVMALFAVFRKLRARSN